MSWLLICWIFGNRGMFRVKKPYMFKILKPLKLWVLPEEPPSQQLPFGKFRYLNMLLYE